MNDMDDHEPRERAGGPAGRSVVPAVAGQDMATLAEQLVASASERGIELTGEDGLLTALTKQVLQSALQAEMDHHLGYGKHEITGRGSGNSRNGTSPKTVTTEIGQIELDVPRDRAGTFEPQIVPKRKRRLSGFDDAVISLYAKGMTTGDIVEHLEEVYDTTISRDLVSTVTEKVTKQMQEWQSRPLDPVYPVVLIDALFLKVRDGSVGNRPVYVAMGVNLDGVRDVLGMWIGPSGGEGSKQWATMLSDLKNRGVQDVCIVCCDGLKGLPDSIRAIWPDATVQTCVVHLVRNSLRLSSRKDWQKVTTGLRRIYTAPTVTAAESEFADFTERWEERYPAMINTWRNAWEEFAPFLEFPPEVRKLIYTTNAIESLNARFRVATKRRGHFPDEQSALKVLYLAIRHREKNKGNNPTGRVNGWQPILNVLSMTYGDRLGLN